MSNDNTNLDLLESEQEFEVELWAVDGCPNPSIFTDAEPRDYNFTMTVCREPGVGVNTVTLTIDGVEYCLDGLELIAALANSLY